MRKTSLALTIASVMAFSALVAACNTTSSLADGSSLTSTSSIANGVSKGIGDTGNVHTN